MNKIHIIILLFLSSCFSCKENTSPPEKVMEEITPSETGGFYNEKEMLAQSVGTQAYLFGVPLMTNMYFRNRMLKMIEISKAKENQLKFNAAADDGLHFNELIHTLNLTNHEMLTAASPNTDTRYSIILFNLEHGAQVLSVPPIKDRYFSINITDAYLGVHPYICSRNGDVNGGNYLFTGPGWEGEVPGGMKEINMPQNNFMVLLRIYVKDPATDMENVTTIQNQFALQFLDKFQGKVTEETLHPINKVKMTKGVEYFKQMVDFMRENPPEGDQEFIWNLMTQVGVDKATKTFDIESLQDPIKSGLEKGFEAGKKILDWQMTRRPEITKTGWYYSLSMGVDNDDYFHRAEWAVKGLLVNRPKEAFYFNAYSDSNGETLHGSNEYVIHIPADKMPPAKAFWSITSYNMERNYVPNEHYHYGVGLRNKGMKYNENGSLTFVLQNEMPEAGLWNWIPTPKDEPFRLNFRFYNPEEVMFDKEKVSDYLPPVEKVKLKN